MDREALIEHYRSQWHRFNARNALKGRPPVDEDQFEELGEKDREENDATSSLTDSELSVELDILQNCRSSHVYFVHKGEVFSIYRCILNRDESTISAWVSQGLLKQHWIFQGLCSCYLFESRDKMTAHKALHRYVVRAKQGGVQSKGTAHSAGATLRRRIPFETKRPLVDEVQRVWERLGSVSQHGAVNDFIAERTRRRQRAKVLVKKKKPDVQWNTEDDKSVERCSMKKKMDHLKSHVNIHDRPVEIDPWPSLDKNVRREIYALIKENNADALREFVNGRNEEEKDEVINFLSSFQFSSDSDTFLHMAARNGCSEVVEYLLEFRSENPNKWNWTRCHIPEPTQLTDEQIIKVAEKKKEKKQRQRERNNLKKEAERKEAEEAVCDLI
ncbi:Vms-1p [Parelaphostrongylus tenuis]|uniref:Vms-1p n=1 Tax=Parelaphostrongylus tenuis TaxID=148309 RepID=A0AAD5N116_PARTN|nr:Vms-1p [Parelaphostrongylus tenuis]KAJ1355129.1 Vms-1p [Parelaphostrongylus tenuis]